MLKKASSPYAKRLSILGISPSFYSPPPATQNGCFRGSGAHPSACAEFFLFNSNFNPCVITFILLTRKCACECI